MSVRWEIQTSAGAVGAIGVVAVSAETDAELDAALGRIGLDAPPVGRAVLRPLLGVDEGLVARWSGRSVSIMPHGGPHVMRRLAAEIAGRLGLAALTGPAERFPEAASLLEARVLEAVAHAPSPLAAPLLLDQVRRWPAEAHDAFNPPPNPGGEAPTLLSRLLRPPLVVAAGGANIGKSALVNALAGRAVSIVADEKGTTRDHVGVLLDCAGLVVRYLDTPGIRDDAGPIERQGAEIASEMIARADLLLLCGDVTQPPPRMGVRRPHLTVALRSDLGRPVWHADVVVSAFRGDGLWELVRAIRERLVPQLALTDPRPWRFWEGVG